MTNRLPTLVLAALFAVGCSDSVPTPSELAVESSEDRMPNVRTYEVTIENLTTGQPLSPGVVATHHPRVRLFSGGHPASDGIKDIAETGDPTAALAALTGAPGVQEVVGTGAPIFRVGGGQGPTALTVEISATRAMRFLSLAVMLICTNDGFVGLDRVSLPGGWAPKVVYARGYDAGTEVNDELSSSIVDPCGAIGPVPFGMDGDAHTDEGGVVGVHPGIAGIGDLTAAHDWTMGGHPERRGPAPAAKVTIQRVR